MMKIKNKIKHKIMEKKSVVSVKRRNLLKGLALLPFAGSFSIVSAATQMVSKDNGYLLFVH